MRSRLWAVAMLGCLLESTGATALVPSALAQDQDTTDHHVELKRKVKSKVLPEYPAIARQMNLRGRVKVETTVAADGHVVSTRVLGGNPVLASAATDAIKKWRFETAPKETTELVEVDFAGESSR
ncbi:MAG TPA: energy transducer TonB [Candidatus Cybelea sp.]|nr:energy transducer TonB [Candidatus Cybelea sp.]